MASCPSCRRPVAVPRPCCLYCGAPLDAGDPATTDEVGREARTAAGAAAPAETPRALVVLDVDRADPASLARVLGLPSYEAGLAVRRGGFRLHRVLGPAEAAAEAARLADAGIRSVLVPEAEARVRPVRAVGGERIEGALALRTEEGPSLVRSGGVLLVVRGPIAREYQSSFERRRVRTARLDEGYRVHLHPRSAAGDAAPGWARPVEIDASAFEFGFAVTGSARLELDAWVESVARGAPSDDAFRWLPPALGPAEPPPKGALSAVTSLRSAPGGGEGGPLELDNVAQFRFYSGWRAAVERRL